jgi:hypothetical protein
MSELKVYHHELRHNEYEEFYLKYEADKVIALLKDKANYNECAYKLKSKELADTCRFYEDELRHHNYKRCLAMASYWVAVSYQCADDKHRQSAESHHRKWLELAKKFKDKEAK